LWVHSRAFTLEKDVRNDEAHINNSDKCNMGREKSAEITWSRRDPM